MAPRTYTTAQVCAIFQVTRQTIRNWVTAGTFPAPLDRPGGNRAPARWDAETVDQLLKAAS